MTLGVSCKALQGPLRASRGWDDPEVILITTEACIPVCTISTSNKRLRDTLKYSSFYTKMFIKHLIELEGIGNK